MLIRNNTDDHSKDKLIWKWTKGAETSQTEFGDPTATASYALCSMPARRRPLSSSGQRAAGGGKWRAIGSKGYKYSDPAGGNSGITKMILKGGADGKSKALVKGKGADLPDFDSDLSIAMGNLPMIVQLRNNGNGLCWKAPSPNPTKNFATQFSAKAP